MQIWGLCYYYWMLCAIVVLYCKLLLFYLEMMIAVLGIRECCIQHVLKVVDTPSRLGLLLWVIAFGIS